MSYKLLNIEISEKVVKVCLTTVSGQRIKIKKAFQFEIIGDIVSDGLISDVESLSEQIRHELRENEVGKVKVATFAFSSAKVASREITLPMVGDKRVAQIIAANASDYFPFDASNYHLHHEITAKIAKPEKTLKILLTAAPKNIVQSYTDLAAAMGVTIKTIDYTPNAIFQTLRTRKTTGVTMYLNINLGSTNAIFIQDKKLILQRNLPFGGEDMVLEAIRKNEIEEPSYLDILMKCCDENWVNSMIGKEDAEYSLNRIVNGVNRNLEFFRSSQQGLKVDSIVLLGNCAKIVGLCEQIQRETEIECIILPEIEGYEKSVLNIRNAINYIPCLGSNIKPMNFVTDDFKKVNKKTKEQNANSLRSSILLCILCLVAGLGLTYTAYIDYSDQKDKIDDIDLEIAMLGDNTAAYDQFIEYTSMNNSLILFNENNRSVNENLANFFDELEEKVPSSLLLLSASCDTTGVDMNITVSTLEDVAVTLATFRTFESIDIIQIGSATVSQNESGEDIVSFALSCLYPEKVVETESTIDLDPEFQP